MGRRYAKPSEYQAMWLFAMFDLPVKTRQQRKRYVQFRNALLDEGFTQLQYSVYARFCGSEEIADVYRRRIAERIPSDGFVRLLAITDRQFGKMQNFVGKRLSENEQPPDQLLLF